MARRIAVPFTEMELSKRKEMSLTLTSEFRCLVFATAPARGASAGQHPLVRWERTTQSIGEMPDGVRQLVTVRESFDGNEAARPCGIRLTLVFCGLAGSVEQFRGRFQPIRLDDSQGPNAEARNRETYRCARRRQAGQNASRTLSGPSPGELPDDERGCGGCAWTTAKGAGRPPRGERVRATGSATTMHLCGNQ